MDAVRHCEDLVLVPGTVHRYALGPMSQPARSAVCAVIAYEGAITESAYAPSEIPIASAKLAWWREELERLEHRQPRHPVTRALASALDSYPIDTHEFRAMIDAVAHDRDADGYASFDALKARCAAVDARTWRLVAGIAAHPRPPPPEHCVEELGVGLALGRFVFRFAHDVRAGRVFIPRDELQRFGLPPADPCHAPDGSVSACLNFQATRAMQYLDRGLAALPTDCKIAQRPLRAIAAMQYACLQEILSRRLRPTRETVVLPPLRMWWIAVRIYGLI